MRGQIPCARAPQRSRPQGHVQRLNLPSRRAPLVRACAAVFSKPSPSLCYAVANLLLKHVVESKNGAPHGKAYTPRISCDDLAVHGDLTWHVVCIGRVPCMQRLVRST
eukprot:9486579-Pyramimonas_sp.AAC.1